MRIHTLSPPMRCRLQVAESGFVCRLLRSRVAVVRSSFER